MPPEPHTAEQFDVDRRVAKVLGWTDLAVDAGDADRDAWVGWPPGVARHGGSSRRTPGAVYVDYYSTRLGPCQQVMDWLTAQGWEFWIGNHGADDRRWMARARRGTAQVEANEVAMPLAICELVLAAAAQEGRG